MGSSPSPPPLKGELEGVPGEVGWGLSLPTKGGLGRVQLNKIMKKLQLTVAITLCGFGCMLITAGFVTPPMGEIHHSVLIAFGEILTFSGSLIGIDYRYRYKE